MRPTKYQPVIDFVTDLAGYYYDGEEFCAQCGNDCGMHILDATADMSVDVEHDYWTQAINRARQLLKELGLS